MTIVEFFDKDAIENIISSLICNPDKVVLVGDNTKAMTKAIARYEKILENHGVSVEFKTVSINRNDLEGIVDALMDLLAEECELTIDLTGGDDLYLVAAGIVYNSHPPCVQLHRFNMNKDAFYDCDADGNVIASSSDGLALTIDENIAAYGGRVIYENETSPIVTHKWNFTDEVVEDIDIMWSICCKNLDEWNDLGTHLVSVGEKTDESNLKLQTTMDKLTEAPKSIKQLERYGLVSDVKIKDGVVSFECKSKCVKACISTSGQLLELKTTLVISSLKEDGVNPIATDVMTGVAIGWDDDPTDEKDVKNEVDVVAMNGLVPIFISCKNGIVEVDELYKLNTVATRFGGKYAKKILIATDELGLIKIRAQEMGIEVVDNIGELGFDHKDVKRKLKNILK